jgi:hypothetical protein
MHQYQSDRQQLSHELYRAEATRLRAEAIDDLFRRIGRTLRSVLTRSRQTVAAASGPRPAPLRPSLARVAS